MSARVLVVNADTRNSSQLIQWLNGRGCHCQCASSYREACRLISEGSFDLILSHYDLPDRSAFPLLERLERSSATLFFSKTVESGSLWLLMLDRGQRCVGRPLLRSQELTSVLGKMLGEAGRYDSDAAVGADIFNHAA